MSMIEDLRRNQIDSWIKTLPPLPPGWVYDFIPGEPKYNPETNTWETTMEAKPRQRIISKDEDERIRNWIVNLLHKLHYNQTAQPMALKAIEYLEKQKEIPMPNSTELIEMWDKEKAMLKEKDFRDDAWRLAYNAFMDGFARGTYVKFEKQKEQKPAEWSEEDK